MVAERLVRCSSTKRTL